MAQTLAFQYQRLGRGAQGISNTIDTQTNAANLLRDNPYTDWSKFTSSATNASAAIGTLAMPSAISALNGLTTIANAVGQMMRGDSINNKDALNSVLFGGKDSSLRKAMDWIEGNRSADKRLFGGGSGPHPVVGPGAWNEAAPIDAIQRGAAHLVSGRDPRSPSTGPLAYAPPAAPTTVNANVSATLSGQATVNVTNNVNVTGLVQTIMSQLKGEIEGLFKSMGAAGTNSNSGHDGRTSPVYPDHVGGIGHN